MVVELDFGSDGKAARKIQEIMTGIHPNASVLIISADEDAEK